MYLKKLHISNFRCFRDYTIEFAPGVTVLFGKNGSGKSTLIHAIHKALSMLMYTKNEYENVMVKGKRKKKLVGYKTITRNNPYLHTKGFANDDFNNLEDSFIEIAATADFGPGLTDGCTNEWILRLESNLFRQAALLAKGVVKNEQGFIARAQLQEEDEPEFQELSHEQQCISDCFNTFTSNSVFNSENAIKFNTFTLGRTKQNEGKLCIQTTNGKEYDFRKLPAGYKRLFNIVLDLAYRSYILSDRSTTNIPGLVIIDEIDLHLHPSLEQVVLQCFQETFQQIQFIVSTHSPLVLTGVETEGKPNVILHMASDDTKPEVTHDIYGIDYNTGIEDVMGVESKNVELDYMVNLCAYMKKRNKIAQAENIMKRILDKFAKNRNEVEKMVEAKEREL